MGEREKMGERESVKALVHSSTGLESIPSEFTFATDLKGSNSDYFPVIDFTLLTSSDPDERSEALRDLDKACREWRFFILVNHGIPETLLKAMIAACLEFFQLPEDVKRRYESEKIVDKVMSGSASHINTTNQTVRLWRDFVKSFVHPEFHCPREPQSLRDNLYEFSEKCRSVFRILMQAVFENLGLDEATVEEALQLESCYQIFNTNYYPPCPQPDQAIGLPPHTDYGFLTLLIHNGVDGLQIERDGEWINTVLPENAILVNHSDHMEIFSNGRYKSLRHRSLVNSEATKISVVLGHGAAPDAVVAPAVALVEKDGRPFYYAMKFMDYVESDMRNRLQGETNLDCIKIKG